MAGEREETGQKGREPGRVKILETCVSCLPESEREKEGGGRCPLLRALLLRRTVTNNYRNRPEINKLFPSRFLCSPTVEESI